MNTTITTVKPIDKLLRSFPLAYEKKNGWYTHDDNPRFDFQEKPDGSISLHAWTGRSAEEVLAMGTPPLALRDLYARSGTVGRVQHQEKLDLLTLSHYLKLDWQFLQQLGYSDGYTYTSSSGQRTTCVKIGGYCAPDGTPHSKNKVRLSVDPAKLRFLWDQNTPGDAIPCGLHTLPMAREHHYLIIGEGESDYATMMFHNLPFLGMSGADGYKSLDVSLLQEIPTVYILEEPDQAQKNMDAGQGFYKNVRSHLRANGYQGNIYSIRFKDATLCKDPSDLHKILYGKIAMQEETVFRAEIRRQFAAALLHARESAIPEGADMQLQTVVEPYIPPMPTTPEGKLHWITELLAVPSSVMSDSQKITLATLALHTDILTSPEKKQMDTAYLSDLAAQSSQTFLSNVAYASTNLGLFEKRHEKIWYTDEMSGKKKCVTHLYIEPTSKVWAAYPSTYRVAEGLPERKHGGKQTPKPQCPVCHSENVDLVVSTICHNCHEISHEETYTSPVPLTFAPDQGPEKHNVNLTEYSAQPEMANEQDTFIVESTIVAPDLEIEKHNVNLTEWISGPELEEETTPEEKVQCQLDSLIDSLNKDDQVDRVDFTPQSETIEECRARWKREALEESHAREQARLTALRHATREEFYV